MAPTQEDSYIVFIGSGALSFSHYNEVAINSGDGDCNGWLVTWTDSNTGEFYRVNHRRIIAALNKMIRNKELRGDWKKECWNFLLDSRRDEVDFDAVSASAVIETASYGEVVYC